MMPESRFPSLLFRFPFGLSSASDRVMSFLPYVTLSGWFRARLLPSASSNTVYFCIHILPIVSHRTTHTAHYRRGVRYVVVHFEMCIADPFMLAQIETLGAFLHSPPPYRLEQIRSSYSHTAYQHSVPFL